MEPALPGFTLSPDSSRSPTLFCSSSLYYACSSHGFSSLQSPSAFPSYSSSDEFSQQFEPSILDDAEPWPSLLPHSVDVEQATSEWQDKLVSQGLLSQTIVVSEDFIRDASLNEDSVIASKQQHDTEISAFLSGQANFPAIAGDSHTCLFVSSQDRAQHLSLLCNPDAKEIKDCESHGCESHAPIVTITTDFHSRKSYASRTLKTKDCESQACEWHAPHSHAPIIAITNGRDPECKDYFQETHQSEIRAPQILEKGSLTTNFSVLSRFEAAKETMQEPLQEVKDRKRVVLPASKLDVVSPTSPLIALKENLKPQSFKEELVNGGSLKVDPGGWLCPRNAKKTFKPKPRQVLLDKWLSRQR